MSDTVSPIRGTAGEREMLDAFLDDYREAMTRKLRGVSEEDARRRLVGSETTLGGLVKHLRWVEQSWFQRVLARTPDDQLLPPPWTDDDPDADFRLDVDETVEGIIAEYERECERSRETAGAYELSATSPHPRFGEVSLRWIYLHMIEETARHVGHADILREQLDGSVEPS
jgi:hypothetical protein